MEGRSVSELYRNASEELFLKSWVENSIGMSTPTMEMMGFKNLSQSFRTDSEELFKSWLTNGENVNNLSGPPYRTRQASRRISSEIVDLSSPQYVGKHQKRISNEGASTVDEVPGVHQQAFRNVVESEVQGSNLYLAKAWFHSSQPMTRSRSSELRRRYAAMQNNQTLFGMESMYDLSGHGVNAMKLDITNSLSFNDLSTCEIPNQPATFVSPSNSSSSIFNASNMYDVDKISSVVNMLKGTLERKKLNNQIDKEALEDSSNAHFCAQETIGNPSFNRSSDNYIHQIPNCLHEFSSVQVKDNRSVDLGFEAFVNPVNPIQSGRVSQEPSQSESSAAAAVVSSGFEPCDGPSNSTQTHSNGESSRKQVAGSRGLENGSRSKDFRERIIDNLKDDRKRGSLVRYGSVTSAASVDKGDPTKKRRVERSRKMAEAKERNMTPTIPSDMQSVLKRCETLEKEVRSLKLNLSFMNRKDSEQTKQIEDLQKQNEDLADEKERLLEEIERILSESGRM
ncbi:protein CYCLOPS-like [Benincasa hispida]|uniref:protein CYCLOPS-like n=1 Tax=Benincasa hispida TaxID=102211 RepID=UPI0018FF37D1|nr:protein CYCLOPS-like [Benincasa hispida]XP_038876571.1 protein CYCLOPS-like [Benincasa hispida]